MTKYIYLIRHGQTEFNKMNIVQGSGVDSNLNAVGHAQGEAFFIRHQHVPFDKVYTSKLRRTHQTVAKFVSKGVAWETLEGLNEISWGVKEGKRLTVDDDAHHAAMLEAWRQGDCHAKAPEGESPWEVMERQKTAWAHIMGQTEEQNILVCMHGRAIRILLCHLLGLPLSDMDTFEHTNTCLYLLGYDEAAGRYEILRRNDTTHLQGIDWARIAALDEAGKAIV
jgi:probable phosphoglycerate mutase